MERINEDAVELIDLGAASEETQGADFGKIDGVQLAGGLPPPGPGLPHTGGAGRRANRRAHEAGPARRCPGRCFRI